MDPNLPEGGGNQVCGLYDVNPDKFGQSKVLVRDNHHYGTQEQVYDGINVWQNTRLRNGLTLQGGISSGRTRTSACYVIDSPEALRFCEITPPFLTSGSLVASYLMPFGIGLSGTYRDYPGVQITANYAVPNSAIQPSLGRPLSSGINGTATVNLVQPGTMYADRQRALDIRASWRHRFGGSYRVMGNLDVFNIFNSTGIVGLNNTYGSELAAADAAAGRPLHQAERAVRLLGDDRPRAKGQRLRAKGLPRAPGSRLRASDGTERGPPCWRAAPISPHDAWGLALACSLMRPDRRANTTPDNSTTNPKRMRSSGQLRFRAKCRWE